MTTQYDMVLSERVQRVQPSATLAMNARAKAMQAKGIQVLALSAGEPDYDTPLYIKEAAYKAIAEGDSKYTPVNGSAALRQAIAGWTQKTYGFTPSIPETIVGTGGKQVLFNAIAALLNPGDEALFASPYWVSYPDMISFADGVPVPVEGPEEHGFLPQAHNIAQAITPRTKVLMLNSPSNPTGAAYSRAQLEAIAEVLRAHPQVFIITDDIYSGLVYDEPFVSIAHVAPDLRHRTLIASGASKTYAMTGWRVGFGIGPKKLIDAMSDLQGASTSGACSIAQAAAAEALSGPQQDVENMRMAFKARRDRMIAGLRTIPGVSVVSPKGAFYAFPRVSAYLNNKTPNTYALCEYLLESAHVALVPGEAFGSKDHVRLSFACSESDIDEAITRIARGLASLKTV